MQTMRFGSCCILLDRIVIEILILIRGCKHRMSIKLVLNNNECKIYLIFNAPVRQQTISINFTYVHAHIYLKQEPR